MSDTRSEKIPHFNSIIEECEVFTSITRDSELQREACARLDGLLSELRTEKQDAITEKDEDFANLLLGFECVANCLRAEITMWLLLKSEKPDEAWDNLVTAQMAAAGAVRAHQGFAHLLYKNEQLEAIEKLVFPPQVFISAGLIVRRQECSICGEEYGECAHLAGKPYWGEFCCIIARDLEADHVAIVENPADKRCRVQGFGIDGGWRNRMTWKIAPQNPDKSETQAETQEPSGALIAKATLLRSGG